MSRTLKALLICLLLLTPGLGMPACASDSHLEFTDIEEQSREFLRHNEEIELSDEQMDTFREALTPIPAPCCSDRSALTCCCPCNQRRVWWGLTKHLIADHGLDAEQTRAKVVEWFAFTHPNGNAGNACYSGRCPLPFEKDGCGGMRESHVAF